MFVICLVTVCIYRIEYDACRVIYSLWSLWGESTIGRFPSQSTSMRKTFKCHDIMYVFVQLSSVTCPVFYKDVIGAIILTTASVCHRLFHSLLAQHQRWIACLCKGASSTLWKRVEIPTDLAIPNIEWGLLTYIEFSTNYSALLVNVPGWNFHCFSEAFESPL